MSAPPDLRCDGCGHRFGRRAHCLLLFGTFALCNVCAHDPKVHRAVFVSCPAHHPPTAHFGDFVTRGRAAQALKQEREG